LRRALFFSLTSQKAVLLLQQIRISLRLQREAKSFVITEHYTLITSQFKISLMLEGKARRFEYKLTADSPLFGANFIRSA